MAEDQIPVTLTGPQETMLATLYLRAMDNRERAPKLGDKWADEAVRRLDYDFTRLGMRPKDTTSVAVRANVIDDEVRSVLCPGMTVLHLGCGLDSRYERVTPPEDVEWYDIDHPEVIELREKLFDDARERHALGKSVTDPDLLTDLPADRPVLLVAEGLTMYLTEQDGTSLLRRVVEHFPLGHLIFDAFNTPGIHLSNRFNPAVTRSGSRLHWGIDDPREITATIPALELVQEVSFLNRPELAGYPLPMRLAFQAADRIPIARRLGRLLHYRF